MNRNILIICILILWSISSNLNVMSSNAQPASPRKWTGEAVNVRLLRKDYPENQFSSYLLEIKSESGPVAVKGFFDLRQDSKRLASIPLIPITQKDSNGGHSTLLRVNCVSHERVDEDSFFYVYISNPHNGERIKAIKVLIRDAKAGEIPEGDSSPE